MSDSFDEPSIVPTAALNETFIAEAVIAYAGKQGKKLKRWRVMFAAGPHLRLDIWTTDQELAEKIKPGDSITVTGVVDSAM